MVAKIQRYVVKTDFTINNYSKDYETGNEVVGENEKSILII